MIDQREKFISENIMVKVPIIRVSNYGTLLNSAWFFRK